jgi:hypothetical protein
MIDIPTLVGPGLIGLAGALVGAFAGYRGSIRGQQLAQQGERDRWRRDRREAAYLRVLSVRGQLARAHVDKGDAMQQWTRAREHSDDPERIPEFDWRQWNDIITPLWAELDEAKAQVQIYGSTAARTAVEEWLTELPSTYGVATRPGGAFGAGIRETIADEEARQRDPFIALLRRELGITD